MLHQRTIKPQRRSEKILLLGQPLLPVRGPGLCQEEWFGAGNVLCEQALKSDRQCFLTGWLFPAFFKMIHSPQVRKLQFPRQSPPISDFLR